MQGTHLIGEFYNCQDSDYMNGVDALRDLCIAKVREAGLTIVGECFHQFEPAGVTGAVILAESHLTIHTWPENGYVTMDVFVCNYSTDNTAKAHKLYEELQKALSPGKEDQHVLQRGRG